MNPPKDKYRKILIIRFSSLGDVILTTPLINKLRNTFPDSSIDFCTKEEFSEVFNSNPYINECIAVQEPFNFQKLKSLKKEILLRKYDLIIDAHRNLRTFYLKLFLWRNHKIFTFKKCTFRKILLVILGINALKNLPSISVRYIDSVTPLKYALKQRYLKPELFTSEPVQTNIDKMFTENNIPTQKKLICLIPSSKHFTKAYPSEYYVKLINYFDKDIFTFILIGKGYDENTINSIWEQTGDYVINLYNKLNIPELYELMRRCNLIIGGDTGPVHIAEASDVPLIFIAGSSVKSFGFFPERKNAVIIENNDLKCRPCSAIGRNNCPKKHFQCMMSLHPEYIYTLVKEALIKSN